MKTIFTSIYVLIASICLGQTNFSGNWILRDMEYKSGPQYSNALPEEMKVKQNADSIIIGSTGVALNGAPTTGNTGDRKFTKTVSWSADKKTATFTTAIYSVGSDSEVELTRVDTWELSPDGKQLVVSRKSIETKSENWEMKGIYEKQ